MKKYRLLFLAIVSGILAASNGWAKITAANQHVMDTLVEMTNALRTEGIESFLAQGTQRKWITPKLFSAWYIARLPDDPDGLRKIEEAKSELGLEFAKQLSLMAKTVRETKDVRLIEKSSNILFGAADWIGQERGYGNLLLQSRVYDIASVAAIKLMADLSYPVDKAEAAMQRFDWAWANAENRRQVLFDESGGTHFVPVQVGDVAKAVLDEWKSGAMFALDQERVRIRPDLAIFTIDDFATTQVFGLPETSWFRKAHFMIGEGNFGSINLRNLESLREFRKRYGTFPTKPVKYVKRAGESDIRAAFWELSWKDPLPVVGAAAVYEDYLNNRLYDDGYRSLLTRR